MSVRSTVSPALYGQRTWAAFDRDGDGQLTGGELGPLRAELKRRETSTTGISVDGRVVDVSGLTLRIEAPEQGPYPVDAELVLRIEGSVRHDIGVGEHRFVVYDQPTKADGVVPFRVAFGRGLRATGGAGSRGEIRNKGQRVEVATTAQAPILWGTFVRADEGP